MILYKRDYLLLTLITIIIVLGSIRTIMADNQTLDGVQLDTIKMQLHKYQVENDALHQTLLEDQSYTTINRKARAMGYVGN